MADYGGFDILEKMLQIRKSVVKADKMQTVFNEYVWPQLISALDTIEDAQCAIDYYVDSAIPDFDEAYLFIYGLFQALYIQQDAAGALYHIASTQSSFEKMQGSIIEEYGALMKIRHIRDDMIGHPTNRGSKAWGKKYIQIVRATISKNSLSYIVKGERIPSSFETIDIIQSIYEQEACIWGILEKTEQLLQSLIGDAYAD